MTLYALPLHKLDVNVEFNVSTAFVKLKGTWKNIAKYKSDCMFVLPLSGTVTGVSIKIHNRLFETLIIPKEDAQEIMQLKKDKKDNKEKLGEEDKLIDPDTNGVSGDKEGETTGQLPPMNYDEYIPNLFRLPISDVGSTDMITVSVSYIEPLQYVEGFYKFTLPLNFAKNLVKSNLKMNKVLSIKCSINSLGQETKWHCNTHKMKQVKGEGKKSALDLVVTDFEDLPQLQEKADLTREAFERDNKTEKQPLKKENPASVDWTLLYSMQSKEILPTLVCEAAEGEEEEGNFLLFVTPPSTPSEHRYGRNMVFLLDRSGSMTGQPYREASRALVHAFSSLKVSDYFTVVCFDHRIECFRKELIEATPRNIEAATAWIASYAPEKGGTEILAPVDWALNLLEKDHKEKKSKKDKDKKVPEKELRLPFIVLLTDGCVENEREICKHVKTKCERTRVLTLGMGSYCNWFFLKTLAEIGRGFSDVVVFKDKIYAQTTQLLQMAAVPILTNVELKVADVSSLELYPFPIQDLFHGAPLTISGYYTGTFPSSIELIGQTPDGKDFKVEVKTRTSEVIPVKKVFIKQRIDLLTARSWLSQTDKALERRVVELSCYESMPSAYTTMVAYETSEEAKQRADDDDPLFGKNKKKKQWWKNKKIIAGLAVGNAVLIGAAAFSFGNLAASAANTPLIGLLGEGIGNFTECCGLCGCGCDGCDCSPCADCLAC